jgi:hypothetical protein
MSATAIRLMRLQLVTVLVTVLAVVGLSLATASPAHAWAWSGTVTLNGKVGCTYATKNAVQWAWVQGSNGEAGWARLGSGGMTRPYSFTFKRAPSSTMTVTVNWGCSIDGGHSTSFGLNRPTAGTTTTRNICYWSPCWL